MQFSDSIKKLASLVPWRQNAKWRKTSIESTVTKPKTPRSLADILEDWGLSKYSVLWSGCLSLSNTKPARFTRGFKISFTPRSDLTCLTTYPSTPPERDTHPLLILLSVRTCSKLAEEYKLVNMPARRTLVVLLCCRFNVLTFSVSLTSLGMGLSPSGFSFSSFFLIFFWLWFVLWEAEDFADQGITVPKKSYDHLGLSPMRPD